MEDTAAYKEILRINCETFEERLTARFNYHRLSSTIIDYNGPVDQGLKESSGKQKCANATHRIKL